MNIYEKNLEVLKQNRTMMYESIMNKANSIDTSNVESTIAKDGTNIIMYRTQIGQVVRLNSSFRPMEEAKRWASQYTFKNLGIVFHMFGLGNGIFVREIINTITDQSRVIIYEPSIEIFMHTIENYDISDLIKNDHVHIVVEGINEFQFGDIVEYCFNQCDYNSQMIGYHPKYNEMFGGYCELYENVIKEITNKFVVSLNTLKMLGKLATVNTFNNIPYIPASNNVIDMRGRIPEDVPVIIVSAGPSLDSNIDLLKEAKGKSVIIAVDRAISSMMKHDILPDFTITLDPESYIHNYSNSRVWDIPLFCDIHSNSEILKTHTGKKVFYNYHDAYTQICKALGREYAEENTGGSVATAAFSVCIAAGIKRVIFIGQDLALKGNQTHASAEKSEPIDETYLIDVEGIYGDIVKTRSDLYIYIKWFEEAVAEVKGKIHCIDATEGGAKKGDMDIMTLRAAIDQYCKTPFSCEQLLKELEQYDIEEDKKKVIDIMEEYNNDVKFIHEKSIQGEREAKKLLEILYKYHGLNNKGINIANNLSDITQKIQNRKMYSVIEIFMSEDIVDEKSDLLQMTEDQFENQKKTYVKAIEVFELLQKACCGIEELILGTLDQLQDK